MSGGAGSGRWAAYGLSLCAMALMFWLRTLPLSPEDLPPAARATSTFSAEDGRDYRYLPGYDSYDWLRAARNLLRTGTPCDAVVDGVCRDTLTLAPVGAPMAYPHSPHVYAIAGLHRLLSRFRAGYPLSASASWVPVVIGTLAVLPAFAIGRRLAGAVGGLAAAIGVGVSPVFLLRSATGDNDVWNVVLPLFIVWAAGGAAAATSAGRQAMYGVAGLLGSGLHALTWRGWVFTYGVVVAGLSAQLLVLAVDSAIRGWPRARHPALRCGAGALAWFALPPAVLGLVKGVRPADLFARVEGAWALLRAAATSPLAEWPLTLATVGELRRPPLGEIAALVGGAAFLLAGWLGLLLLVLPHRNWGQRHFATFLGGNLVCWYLLAHASPSRPLLLALLLVLLSAGLLLQLSGGRAAPGDDQRPMAVLVLIWFLAALFLAFDGLRFTLLLAAPLGLTVGVAIGRLGDWVQRVTTPYASPALTRALPFALLVILLALPVQRGVGTMATVAPRMNDAWWETLIELREHAPANAVVHVWWPYGFFAKYVAERPVSADGASLSTHVPYWLAHALFAADEQETVGLLRMLGCGSDATPHGEKHRGAFYQILAGGLDMIDAYTATLELARRDLPEARLYARERRLREQVLEATHCVPPPAYLVLSDEMTRSSGFRHLGSWSFRNALLVRTVRTHGVADAAAQARRRFGLPEHQARALATQAAALQSDREIEAFVAPEEGLRSSGWIACERGRRAAERRCPLHLRLARQGITLDTFTYDETNRAAATLQWRRGGLSMTGAAAEMIIAGPGGFESVTSPDPLDPRLAVLIDRLQDRILIGTPRFLRSTFAHLSLLDGRYARHFEKVDERTTSYERVTTWRIEWPSDNR